MNYVVRGGTATADLLQKGYKQHQGVPQMYGLSMQYAPNQNKTLKELAAAGRIMNGQISYATPAELASSLQQIGYAMKLIKTPGIGYHHTLCVLYDASNVMLHTLPRDAAEAVSNAMHRTTNPALQP